MDFEKIKELIKSQIDDADVEVTDLTGTRDHLGLVISSHHFKGKMLIEQHRMVMDILKEDLKEDLHAVKIKTIVKN